MKIKTIAVALALLLPTFHAYSNTDAIADKLPGKVDPDKGMDSQCKQDGIIQIGDDYSSLTTLKYFGTSISIHIYDAGDSDVEKALCESLGIVKRLHHLGSDYQTYEGVVNIRSINNAPTEQHKIDPELVELIQAGIDWHRISKGYFNIAVGPVVQEWRRQRNACAAPTEADNGCSLPSKEALAEASKHIDISKIELDAKAGTITMAEGMSLDLGGIAKGWMAEKVLDHLVEAGVRSFVINAGGNIRHWGLHPEGRDFVTAIEDPICKKYDFERPGCDQIDGQFHEIVAGENLTIVSSGNYLKYYRVGDKEYHHIINPNTGAPKTEGVSVSVVMNDQHIYADVLSTTLFLMPEAEAMKMAEELPYLEAVWYLDEQGNKVMTSGFEKYRVKLN
ncbi:FAD:protein FMN transferase [Ferrimonas balearica]|uniref:FAD:protein FMN transferase n=1 Tax=Ferrimonas balearica TaxID=44012 RepID=UPI001C99158F|nr:FAD:protein FMN transferase [Ferrimonas balearica]MBY5921846.1 FAD:protein FMN transferase [Ferrimonas balearica]MBY5994814.1 FAD:protein FMN transferase [Ferrimonas balearica]